MSFNRETSIDRSHTTAAAVRPRTDCRDKCVCTVVPDLSAFVGEKRAKTTETVIVCAAKT